MSLTQDNVSYEKSAQLNGDIAEKPYLTKELLYVIDNNNSTSYSRNTVEFETIAMSNNGKWCDYSNGFISIPLVAVIASNTAFGAGDQENGLLMKNDYCNIIDSITIDYGNNNKIQQNSNISPYLTFKKHTTFSEGDVLVNGHTIGYRRDGHNWTYENTGGIMNNTNALNPQSAQCTSHSAQQQLVMGDNAKQAGDNVFENGGDVGGTHYHVFYYDAILRLKDLMFFSDLPMVRGSNIKITLRMNQGEVSYTRAGGATTVFNSQLNGSVFPAMRRVLVNAVETVSVRVVQNGNYLHEKKQCRLYCPVYTMSPDFERNYLSMGQKKITYEEVFMTRLRAKSGNFQDVLTNSLSRMQRLIMVPVLSASDNGTRQIDPQGSPFASEPATASPNFIRDFNVQLSGSNVYKQNVSFKYETFLNEMAGVFGVNSNQQTGLNSSLIDQKKYNENMGYIVVDLSRRYSSDDNVPMSVQVQGNIQSPKALDFICYITYLKDTTIDLVTGQEVV